MSNNKLGIDCCGDRYEVNTTRFCECGCNLYYCIECYKNHTISLVNNNSISNKNLCDLSNKDLRDLMERGAPGLSKADVISCFLKFLK